MSLRLPALLALLTAVPAANAQSATLLRLANPASVDRMMVDSSGTLLMRGVANGPVQNPGAGTFLMWYPRKAAFRAGTASGALWNDANIGLNSLATGLNATASGYAATAHGVTVVASGDYSSATGFNTTASGAYGVASGNTTTASGDRSLAMGFATTASGPLSTALGSYATTSGFQGSLVYGDASTAVLLAATAANQVSIRATGGVRIFSNAAMSIGVSLAPGGNSWAVVSDRNLKERFLDVDGEALLGRLREVPVSTWRYIGQDDPTVRHIGPMAQAWHRAFGLNADSTTINMSDLDGVNLAAIGALTARTDLLRDHDTAQERRSLRLEAENAALRDALAALESRYAGLERRLLQLERGTASAPR